MELQTQWHRTKGDKDRLKASKGATGGNNQGETDDQTGTGGKASDMKREESHPFKIKQEETRHMQRSVTYSI